MHGRLVYDQKELIANKLEEENLVCAIEEEFLPSHGIYFYRLINRPTGETIEILEALREVIKNSVHNCKVYFTDDNRFYLTIKL
ncbi:hypothetical protein [Bacillus infantis]|uniref:hypothetical protein n=1 Tax=Bacillus infantis TaxID=324767 RepID=UPI003CF888DB